MPSLLLLQHHHLLRLLVAGLVFLASEASSHPRSHDGGEASSFSSSSPPPVCLVTDENDSDCQEGGSATNATTAAAASAHTDCTLFLAESAVQSGRLGLFSGTNRAMGEYVTDPDLILPLLDVNKNEWSPWHDITWSADHTSATILLESYFVIQTLLPGVGSLATCSQRYFNIELDESQLVTDSAGVHRSIHPTSGSFAYRHGVVYKFVRDVQVGEELVLPCRYNEIRGSTPSGRKILDRDFLLQHSICLESLAVNTSTIPHAGRGAFAKRTYQKGEIITSSPVVHFDRSQLDLVYQLEYTDDDLPIPEPRSHNIRYFANQVFHQQLVQNYCFGRQESNVLLLPYGPGVNFINHHASQSNAYVRWSTNNITQRSLSSSYPSMMDLSPMELFAKQANEDELLVFEYVALRDIQPGEEIFLNYGDPWVSHFEEFVHDWEPEEGFSDYETAIEYTNRLGGLEHAIRTLEEQESNPYPENIQTACFYMPPAPDVPILPGTSWQERNFGCLRPCDIVERTTNEMGEFFFSVKLKDVGNVAAPIHCGMYGIAHELSMVNVPLYAIQLADVAYSTDLWQSDVFRNEITLPQDMLPPKWLAADPYPKGDFLPGPVEEYQIEPIRWADGEKVVTSNAYLMRFPKRIREVLLEFCNKMGITDVLRHVTQHGNALNPGQNMNLPLDGDQWYLQRPSKEWSSNLHWLSPAANPAHVNYLQALSIAGFDDVLKAIGDYFDMDGLVAFHVTFIAVSYSIKGFVHLDVTQTQAKTFNVIIPLILSSDETSPPELDILDDTAEREDDPDLLGRYRYEYDVAAMMGDDVSAQFVIGSLPQATSTNGFF